MTLSRKELIKEFIRENNLKTVKRCAGCAERYVCRNPSGNVWGRDG